MKVGFTCETLPTRVARGRDRDVKDVTRKTRGKDDHPFCDDASSSNQCTTRLERAVARARYDATPPGENPTPNKYPTSRVFFFPKSLST